MNIAILGVKLPAAISADVVAGSAILPELVAIAEPVVGLGVGVGIGVGVGVGEAIAGEPDGVAVKEGRELVPAAITVNVLFRV